MKLINLNIRIYYFNVNLLWWNAFWLSLFLEYTSQHSQQAGIAQLGERQTEDLKVACSIHAHRNQYFYYFIFICFLVPKWMVAWVPLQHMLPARKRSIWLVGHTCNWSRGLMASTDARSMGNKRWQRSWMDLLGSHTKILAHLSN